MKFRDLKFDNPSNAAKSFLRLAEMAMAQEITVDPVTNMEAPKWIRLEVYDLRDGNR